MERISNDLKHPKQAYILSLSKLFDRIAYYGIRGTLVLYLIKGDFHIPDENALLYYGNFVSFTYLFIILGAILGDFTIGNKKLSIIGGLIFTIGIFTICAPSFIALIIGLVLITIGNGLYSSNTLALFGKYYLNLPKLADSGIQGYYSVINIGAFLGGFLITMIGDYNFKLSFIISGLMMLISTLILHSFLKDTNHVNVSVSHINPISNSKKTLKIIAVVVISIVLFNIKDLIDTLLLNNSAVLLNNASSNSAIYSLRNLIADNSYNILLTLISALFWSYFTMKKQSKLAFGSLFTFIAIGIVYFGLINPSAINSFILLNVYLLVINLAHVFISPLIFSTIVKYTNPKYLTIALNCFSSGFWFVLNIITGYTLYFLEFKEGKTYHFEFLIMLSIVGLISLGLILFNKKKLKSINQ